MNTGNINYPITASAALTVAGIVLDNSSYLEKGREFAHNSLKYFSKNRLLFGEGSPQNGFSPKGCRAIDLGYNVEESIPALVLYGLLTKDEEVLQTVTVSLQEHLEFMLPDGAWDNSWGSRDFKWTYWGSRTSDGCQTAYALMADRDSRFAEASWRNAMLLKACTYEGILYGGPHYHIKGELPCIHHTFGHVKALAAVMDFSSNKNTDMQHSILPREEAKGIKEYPEIDTWLVALGPWRATITAYDWEYMKNGHPSGGSISMLWHKELGPVLSGSLTEYTMKEPTNMQRVRDSLDFSLTPRLELILDGLYYRNISYNNAVVSYKSTKDEIWFQSEGKLVDRNQKIPDIGQVNYNIKYIFTPRSFEIIINSDLEADKAELRYYLPVISDRSEEINQPTPETVVINKNNKKLFINSSSHIELIKCDNNRVFNHVPGFQAIPLFINVREGSSINIIVK